MRENTARTSTRWGAKIDKNVVGGTTVDCGQFGDMKLLAPQELALSLYAVTDAPIPGIAVDFTIQLGMGSTNHTEQFTVPASDVLAQTPLTLLRCASTVKVSAVIRSVAGAPKLVRVAALVAPTSPTWLTDLDCGEPVT